MSWKLRLLCALLEHLSKRYGPEFVANVITLLPQWMVPLVMQYFGVRIGEDSKICTGVRLENLHQDGFRRLSIGRHCYIGCESFLDLTGEIVIEDEAVLSPRVVVLSHSDVGDRPLARFYPADKFRTVLRRGCWLGTNAVVLGGVEIGEHAVVAAGAVVTKDVQPWTVVAGIPARPVKSVSPNG